MKVDGLICFNVFHVLDLKIYQPCGRRVENKSHINEGKDFIEVYK